ncbi:MAG: YbaK/EbsC family protein [Anaerolineales bacterium]
MTPNTPIARVLQEMGIPHRIFRHTAPIHTLEEAAAARGQSPQQIVRSILFRLGAGEYVLVLAAGPAQISWPKLRRQLGKSRLTMAKPAEVLAITGYPVGAVGPLGLKTPVPILVDESVLVQEEISMGSGERGIAVILRVDDLLRALGGYQTVSLR